MGPLFKSLNLDRTGLERVLGELEAAIMEELWCCGEGCVRDIHKRLSSRKLAYTTVMTVMSRLSEKGLLAKEMKNNAYIYRPLVSKNELNDTMLNQVSDSLKDLALPALVNFVDRLRVDQETLNELEKMIAAKKALLAEDR